MDNDLTPIPGFVDRSDGNAKSFPGQDEAGTKPTSKMHQMTLGIAVVFIVGEMAGSGLLALPQALAGTGWVGVAVLLFCCFCAGYSGLHLGKCWIIMEERWPEYRKKVRYPYPTIGIRAIAPWMRYVVSACVNITLFGAATVYLLLCAQMIRSLLINSGIVACHWVLILGAILCPLTMFGTPAEFWPAALGALVTTALASLLMIIAIAKQAPETTRKYGDVDLKSFFLAFGTILFAFGGASTFPTFQNDMKDKREFPKAAVLGFIGLITLYLPVAVLGYAVYGSAVGSNVVDSMSLGGIRTTVEILLSFHFFFAFLIVFNPIVQELEEVIKVPPFFGWKRCVVRSLVMVGIVFTGETIPHFGKILSLVGASTVTLMTFVFPPLFYMKLCGQQDPSWPERKIPLYQRVFLIEIMIIGIVGGSISTYSAINDIASPHAFTMPCYLNKSSGDL